MSPETLRALPRQGTHDYTPEERYHAALAWTITGTATGASEVTGIPARTIQDWTNAEWWTLLVADARAAKQAELDARLTMIIDKAASRTIERLEHGNAHVLKTGELVYVPVPAQQAATTLAIAYDKRALMRGDPTSRTERVSTEDRLARLQTTFRQVGRDPVTIDAKNTPDPNASD